MRIMNGVLERMMAGTRFWAVGMAIAGLSAFPSAASVINGTFDSGLSGWTATGDVSAAGDALLGDASSNYSLLYQEVALAPGQYRLEFDFLNLLSGDLSADPFAFPDTLFASLYFTNDLGTFDLAGSVFDDVEPLMDLDSMGPYNVAGTLGASTAGPNWTHLTYEFSNNYAYVIPVFELLDFNFVTGDSGVRVDNVALAPITNVIPEPATLTLLAMGALGTLVTRKRIA